ncbi:hypothetical protein PG990_010901 [Apiospora arundinis]
MPLSGKDWLDLVIWIEARALDDAFSVEPHQTAEYEHKGRTKVLLHNLSRHIPTIEPVRQQSSSGPSNLLSSITNLTITGRNQIASPLPGRENVPLTGSSGSRGAGSAQATTQAPTPQASAPQVPRQFRPLNSQQMNSLLAGHSDDLWPDSSDPYRAWLPQSANEIVTNLKRSVGVMQGCAPVSNEVAKRPFRGHLKDPPSWWDLKVPINVDFDLDYRGDQIMRGRHSPAHNRVESGVQPWHALCYMLHRQGWDMGAVLGIHASETDPGSIEVCEIQALLIMLERQKLFDREKRVLRSWMVSVKRKRGFRIMEAWVDQEVEKPELHFSLLEDRPWPKDGEEGELPEHIDDDTTQEWRWLLSWVFAQANPLKSTSVPR